MKDRFALVEEALKNPEEVRRSRSDDSVFLFYRTEHPGRWTCVIVKRLNSTGFLITSYPTGAIKEENGMEQVRVFYDREANTLTIWFDDPQQEHVSEETGDEVMLIKDAVGRVIGFEKLNFTMQSTEPPSIVIETVS